MEFDIKNPAKLEDIEKKYTFHKIQIQIGIILAFVLFFLGIFKNELVILSMIPTMYLFFYFTMFSSYIGNGYRIAPITKYREICPDHCEEVLKFTEKHHEIKEYVKLVNDSCRQLYYFEYFLFIEFINEKEKKLEEDNKKSFCHKLYNELK